MTSQFLDAVIPVPAPQEDRYIWAKVTQTSPLRIQVDGDRTPLGITPDSLVSSIPVNQRVYCQIINRHLIVLGVSGGVAGLTASTSVTANTLAKRDASARIKAANGVAADDVATVGQLIPIGGGITWWGTSDPASPGGGIEYAIPDGRALSRATYAVLFALWGGTFGAGDGSTTFNMPNARGRVQVSRNWADADFDMMGETRGTKTHTLTTAEIPAHTHGIPRHDTGADQTTGGNRGYVTSGGANPMDTFNNSGGGGAHNNIQPSIVANTAIRIK